MVSRSPKSVTSDSDSPTDGISRYVAMTMMTRRAREGLPCVAPPKPIVGVWVYDRPQRERGVCERHRPIAPSPTLCAPLFDTHDLIHRPSRALTS
jgi:hypothetical protein